MEGSLPVFVDFIAHAGLFAIGFVVVYVVGVHYC